MRLPRRTPVLFLFFLLLLPAIASGQGFHAVHTTDGGVVVAAGDNGTIYRSFDSGANWGVHSLGARPLRDVVGTANTMIAVGDSGKIWTSVDQGGNWALTVLSGVPNLRAAAMPQPGVALVVGGGGTIAKSTDGGATWAARTSGTSQRLNAVAFSDTGNGWAAGNGGVLLQTTDGGESWNPVSLGTSNALLSVSQSGDTAWVVGAVGTAFRSTDGGANFTPVNLKLDGRADVRVVRVLPSGVVWLAGGGGFIRKSVDGGATWSFMVHRIHAPMSDLEFFGSSVWATNSSNRTVTYSLDDGVSWGLPNGAGVAFSWIQKYVFPSDPVRGSTFAQNPVYASTFYCAMGENVQRSRDEGETWQNAANLPSYVISVNAFIVSPKDSALWLAAVSGGPDRIIRSTDSGTSWTVVLTAPFGEYGIPLEMDPDHPDTVLFGGENDGPGRAALARSDDFGATWNTLGSTDFRSPCDLVIVPGSTNVIILADGVTGSGRGEFWRSTDSGQSFTMVAQMPSGASEIPGMAISRLNPSVVFGTNWSSGGVRRSTNYGATWSQVDATGSAWGIGIAKDDPNVVMFGRYSGASSLISTNGGTNWTTINVPMGWNNNYSMYLRDRATIFCEQASGIWKLSATYSYAAPAPNQSITLLAPNGGEVVTPGATLEIRWDVQQIVLARLEYRRSNGDPWQFIADVPGYFGNYDWTVPFDGTTTAQVRVSDAWDLAPFDISSGTFTIVAPHLAVSPPALDFGERSSGSSTPMAVTLVNDGTATLHVTSLANATAEFHSGRTSIDILAGQQDTIGVWFEPTVGGAFADTLVIVSDDSANSPIRVALSGTSSSSPLVTLLSPVGAESWQYGALHAITWSAAGVASVDLDYRVHPDSAWIAIATFLPPLPASYDWTIPFAPTDSASVRIRGAGGAPEDLSDSTFALTSPLFATSSDTLYFPVSMLGATNSDTLHIENTGTAPLTISGITVGNPEFWVGRTSLVIPPGASDTVGIFYSPLADGADTTDVVFATDAPFGPHLRVVSGSGSSLVSAEFTASVTAFTLQQNLPNPFRNHTTIRYSLPVATSVSLEVFDLRGNRVATLVSGREEAGPHSVSFGRGAHTANGAHLETLRSGVYFYRLLAGGRSATRKLLLIQ